MKIAIDYDGTISGDHEAWGRAMQVLKDFGHDVFVVTYRSATKDRCEGLDQLEALGYKVWYTDGAAKEFWCLHFGPGKVDVWVDDRPKTVYENSSLSPEGLEEWRKSQGANPNN
jgi:hypothetical protein